MNTYHKTYPLNHILTIQYSLVNLVIMLYNKSLKLIDLSYQTLHRLSDTSLFAPLPGLGNTIFTLASVSLTILYFSNKWYYVIENV